MDPIILHDWFGCSGEVPEARSPQPALIKYVSSGHSSWNWQGPAWWQEIQHGGDLMQIPQSRSVWGWRAAAGRDRRGVMKRSGEMKATAQIFAHLSLWAQGLCEKQINLAAGVAL